MPLLQRTVDADHPWLGLSSFTEETREWFYGREREICDLYLRVREQPLTLLYGQSGLGKTSLLGAGLIPKLRVEGYRPVLIRLGYAPGDPPLIEQVHTVLNGLFGRVGDLETGKLVEAESSLPTEKTDSPTPNPAPYPPPASVSPSLPLSQSPSLPPTLWERLYYLHTRPADLAAAPPVIIFDQFEEIFSLPEARQREAEMLDQKVREPIQAQNRAPDPSDPESPSLKQQAAQARREAAQLKAGVAELFRQLADLIENRPPQAVQERLLGDRRLAREYDFSPGPARVVLTLREDYLSHIEGWKNLLPSLMRNRMALRLLDGSQALEAVVRPGRREGRDLVSNAVGARIVCFVAKREPGTPLEEIGAVPPLLSLLCDELNEARLATGSPAITTGQVDQQSKKILDNFYSRAFEGLHPAARRLVEDRFITVGGHRNSVAHEDALATLSKDGVPDPAAALYQLIHSRLLSPEELGGLQRLELTHDVLATIVKESCDQRKIEEAKEQAERDAEAVIAREQTERDARAAKEQEAQAQRERDHMQRAVVIFAVLSLLALAGALFGWFNQQEARRSAIIARTSAAKAKEAEARALEEKKMAMASAQLAKEAEAVAKEAAINSTSATRQAKEAEEKALSLNKEASRKAHGGARAAFQRGDLRQGIAYLADSLRYDGNNKIVSQDTMLRLQQLPEISALPIIPLLRHKSFVMDAEFSPDGTKIITASADNTVRVWDAATGQSLVELRHGSIVRSAEFSPDGTKIITTSDEETALVWNAVTGQALGKLLHYEREIMSAGFSPDSTQVVTASADKTAQVWDVTTGRTFGKPLRHEAEVISTAFSPDGTKIVTASVDRTARVWNVITGKTLGELLRHDASIVSARFSPDGTRIVTASEDKTARVWDAITHKAVGEPLRHQGGVKSARFSPDGIRVVTASEDKTAQVWDAATGRALGQPLHHDEEVLNASFNLDGTKIVTACSDNTARVWNAVASKALGESLRHEDYVEKATFSPDGTKIVTASADMTAQIWNAVTGQSLGKSLRHTDRVVNATFSPDSTKIVTATKHGIAQLWEASTGEALFHPFVTRELYYKETPVGMAAAMLESSSLLSELPNKIRIGNIAVTLDGTKLITINGGGTALICNPITGQSISRLVHDKGWIINASFSPDGTRVVTTSLDKTTQVWNAITGEAIGKTISHKEYIVSAIFNPDGSKFITISADLTAQLWDATTSQAIGNPLRHEDDIKSEIFSPIRATKATENDNKLIELIAKIILKSAFKKQYGNEGMSATFSPDSTKIVTTSLDNTARVWDATIGQASSKSLRHEDTVLSAAFSMDGSRIITASKDSTSRIWDVATGQALGEPLRHDASVGSAAFSPDDTRIVTASEDGTAQLWDLPWKDSSSPPLWLKDSLIQLAGIKISDEGLQEEIPLEKRINWKATFLAQADDGSNWQHIIRWRLTDPRTRTIFPFSTITVPQHIEREIEWVMSHHSKENGERPEHYSYRMDGLRKIIFDAYSLDPAHPLIHFALAALEIDFQRRRFLLDYGKKHLSKDDATLQKAAEMIKLIENRELK